MDPDACLAGIGIGIRQFILAPGKHTDRDSAIVTLNIVVALSPP